MPGYGTRVQYPGTRTRVPEYRGTRVLTTRAPGYQYPYWGPIELPWYPGTRTSVYGTICPSSKEEI